MYIRGLILACSVILCAGCAPARNAHHPPAGASDAPHQVSLKSRDLSGVLVDNVANARGQGSGFHPLYYGRYPDRPIYRPEFVGLNFEHVFNGVAADKDRSMFTPRNDPCLIVPASSRRAMLRWPAEYSAWNLHCETLYTLAGSGAIDVAFRVTPAAARFPLGYVGFMWASYMNRTRERSIHFIGHDGEREGWISFGDDRENGFETGTVSFFGVPDLPYEDGAQTLNVVEHPTKKFLQPFYYGLLDGDNDLATRDDTLAYIMMFDRAESIRFAVWNFIKDASGRPDPHNPAWDWQFVVRDPHPGRTYAYRARVLIKPFLGRDDVEREYASWRASLRPSASELTASAGRE